MSGKLSLRRTQDHALAKACHGKICYPSRKVAKAQARARSARDRALWFGYKCPLCRHWHLGHARRARSRWVQREHERLMAEALAATS
jgi:hypothetical protein